MTVAPDLAGFRDAQQRKRQHFAEDVAFLGEVTMEFPDGTNIDPETGRPYDPVVEPTGSAQQTAVVPCEVAFNPTRGDPAEPTELGWVEHTDVLLICDVGYASATSGAKDVEVRGERYKVVAMKPDGLTGNDRLLTWGKLR